MSIFDFLDPDGNVIFACHDVTGAENAGFPGALKTSLVDGAFSLNAPPLDVEVFESLSPGGTVVYSRDGLTESSFRIRLERAATASAISAGTSYLGQILRTGGTLRWTGTTDTRYIDFEPSPATALFRGETRGMFKVLKLLQDPEGLPIVIHRQPYLRGPELDSSVNKLVNPTLLLDSDGNGRPDDWAWTLTTDITAESISDTGYTFTIATTGTRNLRQEAAAGSASSGQVWAGSVYAKAKSGTSARAQVVVDFLDSTGAVVGTETLGDAFTLTADEIRLTVVTPAAPANTNRARLSVRFGNTDVNANVIVLRNAQLERDVVGLWVAGEQVVSNDPSNSGGRLWHAHIHGDAPAPARWRISPGAGTVPQEFLVARDGHFIPRRVWVGPLLVTGTDAEAFAAGNVYTTTGASDSVSFDFPVPGDFRERDFRFWLRVRGSGTAAADAFSIIVTPVIGLVTQTAFPAVTFAPGTSAGPVELPVGSLHFPDEEPQSVRLNVAVTRTGGTGNLVLMAMIAAPLKDVGRVTRPTGFSSAVLISDREKGEVRSLSSELMVGLAHTLNGPIPSELQPGLSSVYMHFGTGTVVDGKRAMNRAIAPTVRLIYSPRYFS